MAHNLRNVVRLASSMAWAILPEKLEAMYDVLMLRAHGGRVDAADIAAAAASNNKGKQRVVGTIAVIPVYGVLAQRMDMMSEMSGGTSTESLGRAFDAAMSDPDVGAVVLDIDSPGGSVAGVAELASKIAAARGAKQIKAVANSLAASAAYWIASACDDISVTPSGSVGSIGVFMVHTDTSKMDAEDGVKYTMISAGKFKTEGNPYEPLSDDARAALQVQVDQFYEMFVGAVAKNRGVSASVVRSDYGEGRVLLAKEAVKAGMADKVATLDQVLQSLGASRGASRSAAAEAPALELVAGAVDRAHIDAVLDGERLAARILAMDALTRPNPTPALAVDHVPTSTAGGAAAGDPPIPAILSAPVAKEHPVKEDTAAQTGAAAVDKTDNTTALLELAALGGKSISDVTAWVTAGKTPDQVRAELAAERKGHATPLITGVTDRAAERGFKTFGEQMVAIVQAGTPGGRRDPRLNRINHDILAGTPSGMNESVGSEGGFFIQPDLLPGVIEPVYNDDPLLSRVKDVPIGANKNSVAYNVVDETSRANGSRWGGIQMYWAAEADTKSGSKPKLRKFQLTLQKLLGFAYLTDELMEDAPAAESLITDAFQAELAFMLGDAIFRGSGAGQPLGFMNSGALVTQTIESGQTIANTAASIALNVAKMMAHIPAGLQKNLIWLYNPELLPYLISATNGASGAVPLFMTVGGLANKPFDTILGRPAFASDLCEAVGTPGDLVAIVPSEYHMAKKDMQTAMSIHVRFLYDEQCLRITDRVDGAPVWKQGVTPYKGAATRSPFIVLGTRS